MICKINVLKIFKETCHEERLKPQIENTVEIIYY